MKYIKQYIDISIRINYFKNLMIVINIKKNRPINNFSKILFNNDYQIKIAY